MRAEKEQNEETNIEIRILRPNLIRGDYERIYQGKFLIYATCPSCKRDIHVSGNRTESQLQPVELGRQRQVEAVSIGGATAQSCCIKESWTLKQLYDLNSIYLEIKGNLASFVKLFKLSQEAGMNADHVVRILRLADDNLPRLEGRYLNLKTELKSLEAKKENLIIVISRLY